MNVLYSTRREICSNRLTESEIISQIVSFLVVGYETTSSTLTWCAYDLALNPDIQQKLYEEILTAVEINGNFNYDLLTKLPYLDAVVSETLRLHNPVTKGARICVEDCQLDGTDITVEKDKLISFSIHAIHHNEQYYVNPYKYDPMRFMPQNRQNIKPYTYIPFGCGPRSCIAMRFALMETKITMAYICKKFRISRSPNTSMKPEAKHGFLNTPTDIILNVEER